jgi:ribosomal protein S18 acetylase RimI-like enzyme
VAVREAAVEDAHLVAALMHRFGDEFDDPSPLPTVEDYERHTARLMNAGDTVFLLVGTPACGLAVLRLRESLHQEAKECYLAELYVTPERRGEGFGRALLRAAMEKVRERGASFIDLGTSESDTAARGLYEAEGFTRLDPHGSPMVVYEREL